MPRMAPRTRLSPLDRGDSLARRAYASIQDAIRSGELIHDEIYSEAELGQSLGISRTPVREALLEFARGGLAEILPQRGFRLRRLTEAEVVELFALREVLEGYSVGELAQRAGEADIERLRAVIERQRGADDPGEFLELDETFHLLIPELAGLGRTRDFIRDLRSVMWLVGTVAMSVRTRAPEVIAEHEAIVSAIAEHDGTAAKRALRQHLRRTKSAFGPGKRKSGAVGELADGANGANGAAAGGER